MNLKLKYKKLLKQKIHCDRAVDEQISETDITITHNLQKTENIINWIGNKEDCNKSFELFTIVQE